MIDHSQIKEDERGIAINKPDRKGVGLLAGGFQDLCRIPRHIPRDGVKSLAYEIDHVVRRGDATFPAAFMAMMERAVKELVDIEAMALREEVAAVREQNAELLKTLELSRKAYSDLLVRVKRLEDERKTGGVSRPPIRVQVPMPAVVGSR